MISVALRSLTPAPSSCFLYWMKFGGDPGEPGNVVDDDDVEGLLLRERVCDHLLEDGPVVRGPAVSLVLVFLDHRNVLFVVGAGVCLVLRLDGIRVVV